MHLNLAMKVRIMHNLWIFLCLIGLTSIQIIEPFTITGDDQSEYNLDETQLRLFLPTDSSLSSDLLSMEKKEDTLECLPKNLLFNSLNRNRRASISRPYFHHWRSARENNQLLTKTLLSLLNENESNKRTANGDIQELDGLVYKQQERRANSLNDFQSFLYDYLKEKNIDIAYEDKTVLCLAQPLNNGLIQDIVSGFLNSYHQQNKEEAREQSLTGKNPLWFRYRLG